MRFPAVTVKIWVSFSIALLLYSVVQFLVLVYQVNEYSDREYLEMMASSGGSLIWTNSPEAVSELVNQLEALLFPPPLIEKIFHEVKFQELGDKSYEWSDDTEEILYSIKVIKCNDPGLYHLSYMWSELSGFPSLIFDGLKSSLITLLIMIFPAYFVAMSLVKPLLGMEKQALIIAGGDLSSPIDVNRKDEIGQLGKSLELMRRQLQEQDKTQQKLFQSVSHELKTPVMVIRSHIQAIEDGVGSEIRNLKVIDDEAVRLENKVSKLISMAKLGYMSSHSCIPVNFSLSELIEEVAGKMKQRADHLQWNTELEDISIYASRELMTVLFENILDNQIRYALSMISITVKSDLKTITIEIHNDGPVIADSELSDIFKLFYTGYRGCSGLGLPIVQEICHTLKGQIRAENRSQKTFFIIDLPQSHNFT